MVHFAAFLLLGALIVTGLSICLFLTIRKRRASTASTFASAWGEIDIGFARSGKRGRWRLDEAARILLDAERSKLSAGDIDELIEIEGELSFSKILESDESNQTLRADRLGVAKKTSTLLRLRILGRGRGFVLCLEKVDSFANAIAKAREDNRLATALLDTIPYPIWRRNADLKIVYGNAAYRQLLDWQGRTDSSQELNKAARALAKRARKTAQPQSESQQLIVDGERRLYDLTEVPMGSSGLAGFALDQTALEETQEEFSRHLTAHEEVLQSLGTGIVIFGKNQRLSFYNSAYHGQFQLDEAFLRASPTLGEVLDSLRERRQLAEQADFRSFKASFIRHVMSVFSPSEELLHTPDGRAFRMVASPHPLGGVILTYEDVTDRLALEANYNTLIEVQRETLDHLREGIAVIGSDGRLKLFNPSYAHLWGADPEFLLGQPHARRLIEMMAPFFRFREDWNIIEADLIDDIARRDPKSQRLERDDRRVIDVAAIPLPDGGRLYKYTDVTDSLNMELALRERNEALMAADRLKSEFIANVSYEFRTPLTAIIGYTELLSHQYFGSLNEKQQEYSASILEAAHNLVALISDVIDVAAIEAGYVALQRSSLKIRPLLDAAARLFQGHARRRDIDLVVDCAPDCWGIVGDEQRLKQVFSNLFSNVIAIAPGGETVSVSAKNVGDDVLVEIVFPSGNRAITGESSISSVKASGRNLASGLGLALVRTIVQSHSGRIEIESGGELGKVRCFLPSEHVTTGVVLEFKRD